MPPIFVLASTSPARRHLLEQAGFTPLIYPSRFDEAAVRCNDPAELVERLALGKAEAVAQRFTEAPPAPDTDYVILGCDSVLVLGGQVCGKPGTTEAAIARWHQMRGRTGTLLTGHALLTVPARSAAPPSSQEPLVRHQNTQVHFANASDRQIEAYVATGEPLQCAGAFTLEGQGGLLIEGIEGCYSNVIGLSLPLLRKMLADLGYDVVDFWAGNTECTALPRNN